LIRRIVSSITNPPLTRCSSLLLNLQLELKAKIRLRSENQVFRSFGNMITRSKLVEQLRDYQIRSQHKCPPLTFFSPKLHLSNWYVFIFLSVNWSMKREENHEVSGSNLSGDKKDLVVLPICLSL
ncbi:hypothetical protein H5410_008725, partial [Solanum commersonii]